MATVDNALKADQDRIQMYDMMSNTSGRFQLLLCYGEV
jgi:hypothetical protein